MSLDTSLVVVVDGRCEPLGLEVPVYWGQSLTLELICYEK